MHYSKQPDTMSAQTDNANTAQVVDMMSLLDGASRKRVVTPAEKSESARLLSIRQNLSHQACISVNDIDQLKTLCPQNRVDDVLKQVREFLNVEFGRLRVHRYRQAFTVGHHSLDMLVGGLLRVQFYARQIELPCRDEHSEPRFLSLSWGVGESILEAECERQRRQSSKS